MLIDPQTVAWPQPVEWYLPTSDRCASGAHRVQRLWLRPPDRPTAWHRVIADAFEVLSALAHLIGIIPEFIDRVLEGLQCFDEGGLVRRVTLSRLGRLEDRRAVLADAAADIDVSSECRLRRAI